MRRRSRLWRTLEALLTAGPAARAGPAAGGPAGGAGLGPGAVAQGPAAARQRPGDHQGPGPGRGDQGARAGGPGTGGAGAAAAAGRAGPVRDDRGRLADPPPPDARRLATLLATVRHLEAKSVDDALELLDLLMSTELLNKAQTGADKEQGPQAPPAGQAVGPAGGRGGGPVRLRRLGRPGRGAAGVAGVGGDRGGRLARRPARRAGGGDRDGAAARRGGPGRLAGRAGRPLPDGVGVPEAAARRDLVRGQRRGRAGAGGDAALPDVLAYRAAAAGAADPRPR